MYISQYELSKIVFLWMMLNVLASKRILLFANLGCNRVAISEVRSERRARCKAQDVSPIESRRA